MKNKNSIQKKQKTVPMIIVGESFMGQISKKDVVRNILNLKK